MPLTPLPLEELTREWVSDQPVVSVLCPTYNQVGFVADAFNGFLGQLTHFPFEVIVRDDASTDGTAELVANVAREYPGVVRAILEPENRYPDVDPFSPLIIAARGEYLALCEGDDYWLDPFKLAKQVEVLERTKGAASHHGQIEIRDGVVLEPQDQSGRNLRDRWDLELLTPKKPLLTRTILVRRDVVAHAAEHGQLSRMWAVDTMISALIGVHGGSRFADVWPAVYRIHPSGISTLLKQDPVVRLARKSVDAQEIAALLRNSGFEQFARIHWGVARASASGATVGLLAELPRSCRHRNFGALAARLRAVMRATSARTVVHQVCAVLRAIASSARAAAFPLPHGRGR